MSDRLRVWSYSRCSTCRRALAWLADKGLDHDLIDITSEPPQPDDLAHAMDQLGRKALFNTSGQSYRALGAAAVKAMSDAEALEALASDGKLIKRPFVICPDGAVLVGFKPEVWSEMLPG